MGKFGWYEGVIICNFVCEVREECLLIWLWVEFLFFIVSGRLLFILYFWLEGIKFVFEVFVLCVFCGIFFFGFDIGCCGIFREVLCWFFFCVLFIKGW